MDWDETAFCAEQATLALTGEGFGHPAEARGLLSLPYLRRHLPKTDGYASAMDAETAYSVARALWRKHAAALRNRGEAFTCSTFIEPVLDALGWHRIPQQSMPGQWATRKRPDYCLAASEAAFAAASAADGTGLFQLSATVMEAKSWKHPLDRLSDHETPGWFPSQQIQDYLRHAKDDQGRRFFDWAVLTNGAEWRLYCEHAAPGAHFAFHLVRDDQLCSVEEFRLFHTLFRSSAFERSTETGACFLDGVRMQSLRLQTELEANLRKRIFGVLEDLGTAFVSFEDNRVGADDYAIVYDKSLIFLYRLLFVLYAESRSLLPVREHGPQVNRRYLTEFSLARLTHRLRDRALYRDNAFTGLYEELQKLFHLINGTHPRQNASLGVTRYNGGLFSPALHPELDRWRVGDADLADVLRQLMFAQPPARSRQAQTEISTDEAIDYSTLEVRQLGDIYEGLLGAHFEKVGSRLELRNPNGQNHSAGIFYTPDWIVKFLLRETLEPLLREVEASPEVQRALAAHSSERRCDNSFALALLRLNLVDPAMGSGHFLVRATEWLADRIMQHPTTRPMTRQVVAQGERRVSRGDILAQGLIPVSPGIPQEQAEKAYWRRRVVEACIHGVDLNAMAVELAKLSLWLTCIAADEPLNFLDHHLRCGNSLLHARPDELRAAPLAGREAAEPFFDLGTRLQDVLRGIIRDTLTIEGVPSTEMEHVKEKERLWRELRTRLRPFLDVANLWIAGLDGLPLDALNYRLAARMLLDDAALSKEEKRDAKRFLKAVSKDLETKLADLSPFHWQLEFPDVFFDAEGNLLPPARRGFDAVVGNPPYVSIHTAKEPGNRKMRDALERRVGYVDDLYVHFTDLGFELLRDGGGFGFIVSDTFFTLASKQTMRERLQSQALDWLGQCDPFDATVDAALIVARKRVPAEDHRLRFVQARPLRRDDGSRTTPEKALDGLPSADRIAWDALATETPQGLVRHGAVAELRVHDAPLRLFLEAHRRVFFEPRPCTLRLSERFSVRVKELHADWWERIEDSRAFSANLPELEAYHRTLRPGDVTLVGLIAEGGQGMRTANNARFLAYLDGTPQAEVLRAKAERWTAQWMVEARIRDVFVAALRGAGGDPSRPTADRAAWEQAVHALRERFDVRELGFGRTDLFRIAHAALVAGPKDFAFSLQCRKAELLERWRAREELDAFWNEPSDLGTSGPTRAALRGATEVPDAQFCDLCQTLQRWLARENAMRSAALRIPKDVLGLRSSENYTDPDDAPRVATVYNGLYGRAQFVPFRKGDPEGSRWLDNEPLYCEWSRGAVDWLSTHPSARWQGHRYFLTAGVTWSAVANHVGLKARFQEPCVFDADSMRLTPRPATLSAEVFLAILNSDVFSSIKMRFLQHTAKWEIGNLRQVPLVMPTPAQQAALHGLATLALEAKRQGFAGTGPDNELALRVRELGDRLRREAPRYLRPSAQGLLLATPADCLDVVQKAVNWEAEKLYGVEGEGPFDEF